MGSVELHRARLFKALSRHCPIPVVVEPQSIYLFLDKGILAVKVYSSEWRCCGVGPGSYIAAGILSSSCHQRARQFAALIFACLYWADLISN
jgi:hypothetical protein